MIEFESMVENRGNELGIPEPFCFVVRRFKRLCDVA
jgi:hypothetical protein